MLFVSDNGPALRWGLSAGSLGPFVGGAATYANGSGYRNTGKGSTWEVGRARREAPRVGRAALLRAT